MRDEYEYLPKIGDLVVNLLFTGSVYKDPLLKNPAISLHYRLEKTCEETELDLSAADVTFHLFCSFMINDLLHLYK